VARFIAGSSKKMSNYQAAQAEADAEAAQAAARWKPIASVKLDGHRQLQRELLLPGLVWTRGRYSAAYSVRYRWRC
jgi:hypothetical protein